MSVGVPFLTILLLSGVILIIILIAAAGGLAQNYRSQQDGSYSTGLNIGLRIV